ncbi:MAG TPA: hypothetical protein VF728_10995 [Nocardioides sp.]
MADEPTRADSPARDWPLRTAPLPAMVDDIGVAIIEHGERGDLDRVHPEACLCGGYEPYYLCPGEGIESLTLTTEMFGG